MVIKVIRGMRISDVPQMVTFLGFANVRESMFFSSLGDLNPAIQNISRITNPSFGDAYFHAQFNFMDPRLGLGRIGRSQRR